MNCAQFFEKHCKECSAFNFCNKGMYEIDKCLANFLEFVDDCKGIKEV